MPHISPAQSFTRRRFLLSGAAVSGLGVVAACGGSSASSGAATAALKAKVDGDLELFNWAQYVAPQVVSSFEKKYGVKVSTSFFDSDQAMVDKIAAGVAYDLVIGNSAYLPQLIQAGLLSQLPHGQLGNFSTSLLPFFRSPFYDPGAKYSLPWGYGPTGFAYRSDKITNVTGSWSDLWDHPQARGKIFLLDQIEETIGMSLLRLGYDINSGSDSEVSKAVAAIKSVEPQLAGFTTAAHDMLANGSAWMAHCWITDAYLALQAEKQPPPGNVVFVTPKEGTPVAVDVMTIPKTATHPGTALLFADWVLRPDNSAAQAQYQAQAVGTYTGNTAYNAGVKQYPSLVTGTDILTKGKWKLALTGARRTLWNQAWTEIKAG
jgi:spermidine/putrescine transport system substrate-binding protein